MAPGLRRFDALPIWTVSFTLDPDGAQTVFAGTTTFSVSSQGKVSGTVNLNNPLNIRATLAGIVKDDTWTFAYPYENLDEGCTGT